MVYLNSYLFSCNDRRTREKTARFDGQVRRGETPRPTTETVAFPGQPTCRLLSQFATRWCSIEIFKSGRLENYDNAAIGDRSLQDSRSRI
jgi:hypothetical protein